MNVQTRCTISRTVENRGKLLLSAIGSHYAQQRMILSDHEWPFHASRAISAVAELLLLLLLIFRNLYDLTRLMFVII